MGLIKRRGIVADESAWIAIVAVIVISAASLIGTYYITKPIGEGIGDAFTIFGGQISLYVTIGLTLLGLVFLYMVFGKKSNT